MTMTNNVKKLYKRACLDELFLTELKNDAPSNKAPGFFADQIEKHLFAMCYYGWYIAKYGMYID